MTTTTMKVLSPSLRLIGLALASVLLWNLALYVAPGIGPWVSESIKEFTGKDIFQGGWTEEKRQQDPVGYLEFAKRKLESQQTEIQSQVAGIRQELNGMKTLVHQHKQESQTTWAYLQEAKKLYRAAVNNGQDQSIQFSGRTFPTLAVFKDQVELLFHEHQGQKKQTRQLAEIEGKLAERYYRLSLAVGKIKLASGLIGPQIAIARAAKISTDFDTIAESTMNILTETEQVLREPLIATTAELEKTDPSAKPVTIESKAFENFLARE